MLCQQPPPTKAPGCDRRAVAEVGNANLEWSARCLEALSGKMQPGDAIGFLGVSVFPVRLMVRESEVELAQSVLDRYIAPDEETPEEETDDEQQA